MVAKPKKVDDEERSAQVYIRLDGDHRRHTFGLLGPSRDRDVNVHEASLPGGPPVTRRDWTAGSPERPHRPLGRG
ncbi:hypothetical protein DI494_22355 [Stenotrophomonas maltophilia]|nr:hypothetical protein DI494_22355 [Stenotrophomonas maltophilia]